LPSSHAPPRIGVIGVHDGWSSQRLAAAVARHTGDATVIELQHLALDLSAGSVRHQDRELGDYDALIIKKLGHRYSPELLDRLELLHFLHERGVRVFSRPEALMRLLDRLSCTVILRLADIPMPPTVITEDSAVAEAAVAEYGKAIFKPLYTSKARGMQVIGAGSDAAEKIAAFRAAGNTMLYIQKMVDLPGHDLGLVFLGGEYQACYARVAHGESWNTSTSRGGKYRAYEPSDEIIALAQRAQAPFGLDFTSVDVVETADGPLVFEVSAFGGFRGLLEGCGIDAAQRYVDYVLRKLKA
jgi:tetrahydromethanopterin:alpha-L-glutamate ligase